MTMKDLLYDLQHYEMLDSIQQKEIRETYNLTSSQIKELIKEVL